jgi:hypothetical protein
MHRLMLAFRRVEPQGAAARFAYALVSKGHLLRPEMANLGKYTRVDASVSGSAPLAFVAIR